MRLINRVKELFIVWADKHKADHSEWIDVDYFGTIRLFAPTDWLTNKRGAIQLENSNGEVYSLDELNDDQLTDIMECIV